MAELKTLEKMMQDALPATGCMVDGKGRFMETIHPETQEIWMTRSPITKDDFNAWEPELPLNKTGSGKSAMDMAAFRHCPTGADTPIKLQTIGGRECMLVCKPGEMVPPAGDGMPMEITVIKAHTLGFDTGTTVKILTVGDQCFVDVIDQPDHHNTLVPPAGGRFSEITLNEPWIVELPYPAKTYFWITPSGARSFQGPVTLPK